MQIGIWFYLITGLWGMAVVANLIQATRICYAIEEHLGRPFLKYGLPRFANIVPVALNIGVPPDDQTQAMRWEMNKRLLLILGGFVAFFVFVSVTGPGSGSAA